MEATSKEGSSEPRVDFPLSSAARVENEVKHATEEVLFNPDSAYVMHLTWRDKSGNLQHRTWKKSFGAREDLDSAINEFTDHLKN